MGLIRSVLAALVLGTLSALCILWYDVPIARALAEWPEIAHRIADRGTEVLDLITAKDRQDVVLPGALLALALVLRIWPTRRGLSRLLVLVALSCFFSHFIVGVLKPLVGRLRPSEIAEQGWVNRFDAGGSSFPSGHTAYYWGLVLPLARAWPRARYFVVLPAVFVAVARVVEGAHFPGDVLASLAITVLVWTLIETLIPGRKARAPEPEPEPAPSEAT